jgi:hypothetical protein
MAFSRAAGAKPIYETFRPEPLTPELPSRAGPASVALAMVRDLLRNWPLDDSGRDTDRWYPPAACARGSGS